MLCLNYKNLSIKEVHIAEGQSLIICIGVMSLNILHKEIQSNHSFLGEVLMILLFPALQIFYYGNAIVTIELKNKIKISAR